MDAPSVGREQPGEHWAGLAARRYHLELRGGGRVLPLDLLGPDDPEHLLDTPETRDRFAREEYLPYWAQLWPASVVLAEALLDEANHAAWGGAVLELGCGLGLAGVVAAKLGATVACSDYDSTALAYAARNAELNGCTVEPLLLDWFRPEAAGGRRWPLIIGSDLAYEARLIPAVVRCARAVLAPGGRLIWTSPRRRHWPDAIAALTAASFTVTQREAATFLPEGVNTEVSVCVARG